MLSQTGSGGRPGGDTVIDDDNLLPSEVEGFGYRADQRGWLFAAEPSARRLALAGTALVLLAVVTVTGLASPQQITYERTATEEVESVFDDPE